MRFVLAVAAVIVEGDRVLAMRRSASRDAGAGVWETPSGRVAPDEAPLDAIVREIREETGLEVALDPRPIDAYTARRGDAPMAVIVYRAARLRGEVVRSEEHDAHAWWTPAELRANGAPARLVEAIERALTTPAASPGARGGAGRGEA